MKTIDINEITLTGYDALGAYAVATDESGETCGVSLAGQDEVVRSLDEIGVGDVVEIGTDEPRRVTSWAEAL